MTSRPALFLDRDGVLNPDVGHPHRPEHARLFEDVIPALKRIQAVGYVMVVVSNQSGVGRGLFGRADVDRFNRLLGDKLSGGGVEIPLDHFYVCEHAPDAECSCRKPRPGLLLAAAERLHLDLTRSLMVGDRQSDLETARRAGVRGILLSRESSRERNTPHVVSSLHDVADLLERLCDGREPDAGRHEP